MAHTTALPTPTGPIDALAASPAPLASHLDLYGGSLSLLTDLYQLTMAQGYWLSGMEHTEAVFHLFFRKPPFQGGYALAAGLGTALAFLERFRFDPSDLAYLATLTGNDGQALFQPGFLEYLGAMRLTVDVDAMAEGTVVFASEPLMRVTGPLIHCQLLETALLNIVNFQTLIATKASRVCQMAHPDPVLEFGLRRAQGIDGGLSATRAAVVGGCQATSNVLAGKLFGIPVRGTHAHSWVMSFDTELEAFEAYARAMPNNVVLLVDTYDTLEGVRHAVEIGHKLRARGHELAGIRLDSGDLAWLSQQARVILDEGGFPNAAIVASNDLEERTIRSLKDQGACIGVWGVGTHLVTGASQPALGGVYKLSAVREPGQEWKPRIKLSEQRIKVSNPGMLQVRRFWRALQGEGAAGVEFVGDMIYDAAQGLPPSDVIVDPLDDTRRKRLEGPWRDLLEPVMRQGQRLGTASLGRTLWQIREDARRELEGFHEGVRRLDNPHDYPAGLELGLHEHKRRLILEARGFSPETGEPLQGERES